MPHFHSIVFLFSAVGHLVIDHKILDIFQIKRLFFLLAVSSWLRVDRDGYRGIHIGTLLYDSARDMLTFYDRNIQEEHNKLGNITFFRDFMQQKPAFVDKYIITLSNISNIKHDTHAQTKKILLISLHKTVMNKLERRDPNPGSRPSLKLVQLPR